MTSTYSDTHDERARELAGTGTSVRRTGKGVLADLREALGLSAEGSLTRAEAAYAHLASFQAGDVVDVAGEELFMPGVITQAQRPGGDALTAAYITVGGDGAQTRISVASLLGGMTVTLQNEAARGNVRYFDDAGYAAQNG